MRLARVRPPSAGRAAIAGECVHRVLRLSLLRQTSSTYSMGAPDGLRVLVAYWLNNFTKERSWQQNSD